MSLALLATGTSVYNTVKLVDNIVSVMLRLSGLGILALTSSSSSLSTLTSLTKSSNPDQDLMELYNLDLIGKFRYIGCILMDFQSVCTHHTYLDRSDLMNRLFGSSTHLNSFINTTTTSSSSKNPSFLLQEENPQEEDQKEKLKTPFPCPCLCESKVFQESLFQLSEIAEEAYAHIIAIEYRREQHKKSYYQYIPFMNYVDHSSNIIPLKTRIIPKLNQLITQCLQSSEWANTILKFKS